MRYFSALLTCLLLFWSLSFGASASHHTEIIIDQVAHAFDTHIVEHEGTSADQICTCQENECSAEVENLVRVPLRWESGVVNYEACEVLLQVSIWALERVIFSHPPTAPPSRPSCEYSAAIGISARLLL